MAEGLIESSIYEVLISSDWFYLYFCSLQLQIYPFSQRQQDFLGCQSAFPFLPEDANRPKNPNRSFRRLLLMVMMMTIMGIQTKSEEANNTR